MAFPASPSDGQVYDKYKYNSTISAWERLGDIIESGSNTNGSYIKYSDGTLIQHSNGKLTMTGTAANSTRWVEWTFPAECFDLNYSVSWYFMENTSGTGYYNSSAANIGTSTTSCVFSGYANNTGTSYCSAIFIGKWK